MIDLSLTDPVTHIDGTVESRAYAPEHLVGPAGILQGGLASGLLLAAARAADRFGAPPTSVDARLHAPTPVDKYLRARAKRTAGAHYDAEVLDGDTVLVSGTVELGGHDPTPRVPDLAALAAVPLPDAQPEASVAPACWVCGRDNPHGLHLYPAWTPDGSIVQGWIPSEELAREDGMLDNLAICAVLDCPTVFCATDAMEEAGFGGALLAGFHVRFFRDAPVMEPLRVVARFDDADGRKLRARSALIDEEGTVYAMASALQIGVAEFPA